MKKTVLIIAHISPYPAIQGNRKVIAQLIEWLRGQGLHVVYLWQTWNVTPEVCDGLRRMVDELILIDAKRFPGARVRNTRDFWPETLDAIQEVLARLDVRAVVAEYLYMTTYFPYIPPSILRLTQTIDMLSRIASIVGANGVATDNRVCSPDEERSALLKGDVILAIQEYEASLFRSLVPERPVVTLGYAVTPFNTTFSPISYINHTVLLTASRNPLNRDGLLWFLAEIWPDVLNRQPNALLRVAGEVCMHLPPGTPSCIPLGVVNDLAQEYAAATVVINPTRYGTGLKIKTIEALAYGKALVSTLLGVEGLVLPDETPCIVADSAETFACAVTTILENDTIRSSLESRAIRYVRLYFSLDIVFYGLLNLFRTRNILQ